MKFTFGGSEGSGSGYGVVCIHKDLFGARQSGLLLYFLPFRRRVEKV